MPEAAAEDVAASGSKPRLTVERVIEVTAAYYGALASEVTGHRRIASFMRARHVAMYLSRTLVFAPYTVIGTAFGNRHHSTIVHGVNAVLDQLPRDRLLADEVAELRAILRGQQAAS